MKRINGLSLIEVMIAIVIIAVGVIAAAGLQGAALKSSSKAQQLNSLTEIAENELSLQRHSDGTGTECGSDMPSGYSCNLTIVACDVQNGDIVCSESITDPKAYKISVTVNNSSDETISLSTILTDKLYAGKVMAE